MTDWTTFRPGQFDRSRLGKREPAPGLFGRSEAQQMPGQGDLLDDITAPDDAPEGDSPCLELF